MGWGPFHSQLIYAQYVFLKKGDLKSGNRKGTSLKKKFVSLKGRGYSEVLGKIKWEGGLGWGTDVDPRLIHVNAWQKPL